MLHPSLRAAPATRSWLAGLMLSLLAATGVAQELVLLGDRATLNAPVQAPATFLRINFRRTYSIPPLVFVLQDAANPDPARVRITNVTRTGFDIAQFEAPGEDARTTAAQITYLAISPGSYNVSGTRIEAGSVPVSAYQSRLLTGDSWQTLTFSNAFTAPAMLLLEIQNSANGALSPGNAPSPWLTTAVRNVSGSAAEIALERSETTSGAVTAPEQVAYLAMASGTSGNLGGPGGAFQFEALRSTNSIRGWDNGCFTVPFGGSYTAPLVLADKSSRNGTDGGWLRRCGLSGAGVGLTIDEDRAGDNERNHISETASVLLFSRAFDANLPNGRGWEADTVNLPAYNGATVAFTPISFAAPFAQAPLIFTLPTETDSDPASIRIRSVTSSGFEAAAVEPPGSPGAHDAMTIDYLAVLPGQYRLLDGAEFEAGFIDTSRVQRAPLVGGAQGWDSVTFTGSYAAPPALLAQLQTTANSGPAADPSLPFVPWLTVAVDNLSAAGVRLALERSEVDSGSVTAPERIGYLAMTPDRHGTMTDLGGAALQYDTRLHTAGVRGYDDGCFAVPFTSAFPAPPLAIAHGTTRSGNNGGWVRRCGLSATAIDLHVDEDISADSERSHINENVAVLAFERPFLWGPFPDLLLTSTLLSISDGIGNPMPKAIPGAVLEYQVTVTNAGQGIGDVDSVVITDAVPAGTELFVGDLDGSGGPIVFVDGSPPESSGLLFDAATDVSFSNDGGTSYGYLPGAGDWDPAVTNLRINPRGAFAAGSGGNTPFFTLRYRVRVR